MTRPGVFTGNIIGRYKIVYLRSGNVGGDRMCNL